MAKCRPMLVFVLIFTWTAIPALACLPNQSMTQAEMACCKKMAGDCHRGVGQHPCCNTKVQQAAPVATLDRTAARIHPYVAVAWLDVALAPEPTPDRAASSELRALPSPAPPGLNPILRI
jgi:hypothetical protein